MDSTVQNSWWHKGMQFVSGNIMLQALGFITGILIVRAMSVSDYALYTIYIGLIFALTSLSDSGVGSTLLAHGAKVREDSQQLAAWFRSGLLFRRRIGLWLSILGVGCLLFLYNVNGATLWESVAGSAIMVLTLEAVYQRGVWQVYFRLQLLAGRAQNVLIFSAVIRLILVALTLVLPGYALTLLLVINALTYWGEAWLLKREGRSYLDRHSAVHPLANQAFRAAFRQVLPMNLVNVVRGQSVVFLLSVLGSTVVVSQVAALSRFSMVFAILNAVVLELLSPRIARLTEGRSGVLRAMMKVLLIYSSFSMLIVVCMIPAADLILWLLGSGYSGLQIELIVISIGSAGINLAIAWGSLNHARLWVAGSWTLLPLTIVWGIFGVITLDLGSSTGAAIFFATQAIPLVLTELIRSAKGFYGASKDTDVR